MTNPSGRWTRVPAILSFPDASGFTETYGFAGASGRVWLEGQYLIPRERPSRTLYLFMHPTSTLHLLPMPEALVVAAHRTCSPAPTSAAGIGSNCKVLEGCMNRYSVFDGRSRGIRY